jgi:hypothetical protein
MISRRNALKGAAVSALALFGERARAAFHGSTSGSVPSQWYALPVGGGGFQTKMAIHPATGTIFSGTDEFGCYAGSTVVGTINTQLLTSSSFPPSGLGTPLLSGDIYSLAIDPSNPNNLWVYYSTANITANTSTVLLSTDGGAHWNLTGFPYTNVNGNGTLHSTIDGQMNVDPVNSNVVYVGDSSGVWVTFNQGSTFALISTGTIPAPGTEPAICGIAFDTSHSPPTTVVSGQTVTTRILVGCNGHGVYESVDGGVTWALISGSPSAYTSAAIGSDGNYYCVNYSSGALTRISPAHVVTPITTSGIGRFAIDPGDPSHAVGLDVFGGGNYTFGGPINSGTPTATHNGGGGGVAIHAPDAPWLQLTGNPAGGTILWDPLLTTSSTSMSIVSSGNQTITVGIGLNIVAGDYLRIHYTANSTSYMLGNCVSYNSSTGVLVFTAGSFNLGHGGTYPYLGQAIGTGGGSGPFSAWTVTKERIWYACGVGLIYIDAPPYNGGALNFYSQTFGIETLSSGSVVWPPGNAPQLIASDFPFRPVLTNPVGATVGNSYLEPGQSPGSIIDGAHICWVANDPATMYGTTTGWIGKSTNNGATWTALSGSPTLSGHGNWIAASTDLSIVVAPGNSGTMQYSTDGGATWANSTGGPSSFPGGGFSQYSNAVTFLYADPITAGTYFLYSTPSIYKSTDGGATWSVVVSGLTSANNPISMAMVPGRSGHILLSFGENGFGGSSWSAVVANYPATGGPGGFWSAVFYNDSTGIATAMPNTGSMLAVGTGAAKPGGNGYPSLWLSGWVKVAGVWTYSPSWRVDNFDPTNIAATTYINTGSYIANSMDLPNNIIGDPNNWDCAIASFNGSGWAIRWNSGATWP